MSFYDRLKDGALTTASIQVELEQCRPEKGDASLVQLTIKLSSAAFIEINVFLSFKISEKKNKALSFGVIMRQKKEITNDRQCKSPAVGAELESQPERFMIPADKQHGLAAGSPQGLEDKMGVSQRERKIGTVKQKKCQLFGPDTIKCECEHEKRRALDSRHGKCIVTPTAVDVACETLTCPGETSCGTPCSTVTAPLCRFTAHITGTLLLVRPSPQSSQYTLLSC